MAVSVPLRRLSAREFKIAYMIKKIIAFPIPRNINATIDIAADNTNVLFLPKRSAMAPVGISKIILPMACNEIMSATFTAVNNSDLRYNVYIGRKNIIPLKRLNA